MNLPANSHVPPNARTCVLSIGGRNVFVMDSVSFATAEDTGHIIVTGSHGGHSAGEYAARIAPLVSVCSDAGIGKNRAGVAGLRDLDDVGMIGIGVSHDSARIGDAADIWENGLISYVNEAGRRAGFSEGGGLAGAIAAFLADAPRASDRTSAPAAKPMSRQVIGDIAGRKVVSMDSISIIEDSDRDQIVIAGSNGGVASGELASRIGCAFVALNDAGVGKDRAGIVGLEQIGAIGMPGVGISHDSAEISDAVDMWQNGRISFVNEAARALGFEAGGGLRDSVMRLFSR